MNEINLNDIEKIIKTNPKYAGIYTGIGMIDKTIRALVKEIIEIKADNPSAFFIKTTLGNQTYNLYIYNSETSVTKGHAWTLADFLSKCETKMIEYEVEKAVSEIIKRI